MDEVFETAVGPTRLRVVGGSGRLMPLVMVHGGPGMTWDYLEEFDALAADGRPIVYYDQLGTGGSRGTKAESVTPELLVRQLELVVERAVGTRDYAVLTHSSGSVIGLEYALRKPSGLARMVVANGFAASDHAVASFARHCRALEPAQSRAVIESDFESPQYTEAVSTFYERHLFRTPPSAGLQRTLAAVASNPAVMQRLWGRDIFHLDGLYAGWSVAGRLGEIEVPVLVYRGEHDETGWECMDPLVSGLPQAKAAIIPETSHVPHMERPEATLTLVRDFLGKV